MNKILIPYLIVLLTHTCFGQTISRDIYPESIRKEISLNWIVRDTTSGDLNKDGRTDIALVIQNNNKNHYKIENNGLGYDSINENERYLLIFFKTNTGYTLFNTIDSIIPEHDSPTISDPYSGIMISNGLLHVGYHYWANAGSWLMFNTEYIFQFLNEDFFLIGIEHDSMDRGTMEREKVSINFITRKMLIVNTIPEGENGEEEKSNSEWKTLELERLYKISELSPTNIKVLDRFF
ncbi:hypothetical protein QWY31_09520 [Cytophagales bacterium LB-30]|uniref:VCBS repeat-containing protein n=1 Tax=Shiella aurantiaca TaxID=3058365 RepID=A0ABT8F700_9BACT|nr:hypothetical protein [Shiella aurantiaca]MDN4165741.1 hypothetical protein [Shiella aurantiaca]